MKQERIGRNAIIVALLFVVMLLSSLISGNETPSRRTTTINENHIRKYRLKLNQEKELHRRLLEEYATEEVKEEEEYLQFQPLQRRTLTRLNALPNPKEEDEELERVLQRKRNNRRKRQRKRPQRPKRRKPKKKGSKIEDVEQKIAALIENLNDMIEAETSDGDSGKTIDIALVAGEDSNGSNAAYEDNEVNKVTMEGGESIVTNLGSEGDVSVGGSNGDIDNEGIEAGLTSESTTGKPTGGNAPATPKVRHGCVTPEFDDSLPCPDLSLAAICDKYNVATKPDGTRLANFRDCYQLCKPSFCCIHDSRSQEYSPTCRDEPNCPLYFPCYIIWWKLHDTIGPANFLRVGQREPFYDTVDFNYILTDLNTDPDFFRQLFGHHFDTEFDGPGEAPTDETFQNSTLW